MREHLNRNDANGNFKEFSFLFILTQLKWIRLNWFFCIVERDSFRVDELSKENEFLWWTAGLSWSYYKNKKKNKMKICVHLVGKFTSFRKCTIFLYVEKPFWNDVCHFSKISWELIQLTMSLLPFVQNFVVIYTNVWYEHYNEIQSMA